MEYKKLSIKEIKPYERNPRIIPDRAIDAVASSIMEFGFRNPIILDKNHVIIAGHTRYLAAKKLGLEEVPILYADDMTPEQVKAYRLADNKTGELAEWDATLLLNEIKDLDSEFDLSETFKDILASDSADEENEKLEEMELKPYRKVHYLISCDVNINDSVLKAIETLQYQEGVEIESTAN